MGIRIEVTADDIKKGDVGSETSCPVALAIRRTIRGLDAQAEVRVDGCDVDLVDDLGNVVASFPQPHEVESFISCFDDGLPVDPFAFELPVDELPRP